MEDDRQLCDGKRLGVKIGQEGLSMLNAGVAVLRRAGSLFGDSRSGMAGMMLRNEGALSAVFAKSCILIVMVVLGAHVPLTLMAQLNGLPFETYLKISPVVTLLGIAFAAAILIPDYKSIRNFDVKVTALVMMLGLAGAVLSLATSRHSSDDYFYIPNAIHFLENPAEKMDFVQHYYKDSNGLQLSSYNQGTSLTFEYIQAVVAHYTGSGFLSVYYIYSLALMGFLVPVANYLLIGKFTANSVHALAGTVVAVSVLLLLTETGRTFGNFAFPRVFQGKAVFMSIGLPAFAAFSLTYFKEAGIRKWAALFFCMVACIGMTSTAVLMIPMLAFVLLLTNWFVNMPRPLVFRIATRDVMYMASTGAAFAYAIFLFLAVKGGSSVDPLAVQGEMDFMSHARHLADPDWPLTPVLVALSTAGLLLLGGWQRQFLVVWIILVLGLFMNPWSADLLVGSVIPPNIYWRCFYLYPFPLVAALVGAELWRRLEDGKHGAAGTLLMSLLLCVSLAQYLNHFYRRDEVQWAGYKIPSVDLALAQSIAEIAPDGLMLAPPNVYGIIPMLAANKPQVRMRGDSRAVVEPGEYFMTIRASRFAGGEVRFRNEFVELVSKKTVDVLVIKSALLSDNRPQPTLGHILESNGYINRGRAGEYSIIWR